MTASPHASWLRPTAAVDCWRAFWFRPEPAYTLGLVRIAFGALAVAWTVSLLPDLHALFGMDGVAPHQPSRAYQRGVFEIWTSDPALLIGWTVLLVSALAMTIGWHSRLAALAVFVLIVSLQFRNPWVFNSGDVLIRIEALFLAVSPCGAALSLDRRRTAGSFWSAQVRAPWPLRLMQVQLSVIYLSTVRIKMSGDKWPDGTAVSYALRLEDMLIVPSPHWFSTNALLMNAITWATLVLELSIGILVWSRRVRPWVLAAGIAMHTMIMIAIAIGFFSLAMFVLYLAFVPPETVRRLPDTIKHFVARHRGRHPTMPAKHEPRVVAERNGHKYLGAAKHPPMGSAVSALTAASAETVPLSTALPPGGVGGNGGRGGALGGTAVTAAAVPPAAPAATVRVEADELSAREQVLRKLPLPYSLALRLRDAGVAPEVVCEYVAVEKDSLDGVYRVAEAKLLAEQQRRRVRTACAEKPTVSP